MLSRILCAGVLVAGVILSIAPVAVAAPLPGPDPAPAPAPGSDGGGTGCQNGEVMQYGNCIPAMTPATSADDGQQLPPEAPLRYTDSHTSTTTTGIPADLVPNINGTPCTGYWMSAACYAEGQDDAPAVVPRSTISSSP